MLLFVGSVQGMHLPISSEALKCFPFLPPFPKPKHLQTHTIHNGMAKATGAVLDVIAEYGKSHPFDYPFTT